MKNLVFLLEEESAKALLDNLLPRIFPELYFLCIAFEGKQDLEKNIPIKLKGYKVPNTKFIILRDQDSEDCYNIKNRLQESCAQASKPETLIRIACKELEAWYFGDLPAVGSAFKLTNLNKVVRNKKYRNHDSIINPKQELKKLTKDKYNQVSGSRAIAGFMDIERNSSDSFNIFIQGIKNILET